MDLHEILEPYRTSKLASSAYIIAKKMSSLLYDGFILPQQSHCSQKKQLLTIFSDMKWDFSMEYYTFDFNEENQDMCVIVTPFGNYYINKSPWLYIYSCLFPAFHWKYLS